ncbi:terminase [Devosia pacifica]|uniref:Terminase n=1 Tax=Devosia pacifica TaxID=1335967 RepID=A0A918RVW7_9HYPH|nr:terminase TerL endonuclease subunit [Devosia pacifica]GHA11368.1 terminase [Devosia pacifica]
MTTPTPTWVCDDSAIPDPLGYGERAVKFIKALKHPKSTAPGRAFQLARWQERIVRRIYGDVDANGKRRVRHAVILLPRGNRKTSLGAALGLLHTFGPEKVPLGEAVVGASDQKQASIAFDEAIGIVEATKGLARVAKLRPSIKTFSYPTKGAKFEALSSDAGTQHGRTPNFALVDELHAHKSRDLWDVIRTGLVKVPNSLMLTITTAGRGTENVAYEAIDYARKVARGEIDDLATLPILFEADPEEDWRDESVWHRVNPGLADGFPDIEGLRQLAREAAEKPADREAFKQLHLNMWGEHSHAPFVEMHVYDRGNVTVDLEALRGQPCWIGVDLSSTTDLTAVIAAWRVGDGYAVKSWFYCPAENLTARSQRDGVPYLEWAAQGFIEPTPGNVVDYDHVERRICELSEEFDVREIAFDPHLARQTMNNLQAKGLPVVEFRQGWLTMAPAVMELERAVIAGRFHHAGNPILRWHFGNIAVVTDAAGNKSFHKAKSADRIDGAVASAMAVARASQGNTGRSVYEDRGLLII